MSWYLCDVLTFGGLAGELLCFRRWGATPTGLITAVPFVAVAVAGSLFAAANLGLM